MATPFCLARSVCLAASCLVTTAGPGGLFAQPSASPRSPDELSLQAELLFWGSMKDSQDPAELRAYIESYPQGRFVPLAQARLKSLAARAADVSGGALKNAAATPSPSPDGERQPPATAVGRPPGLRPGQRFRDCDACPAMVVIPAGRFVMGSDTAGAAEAPAHEVAIAYDVAIGVYEVSVGEWTACVRDGACPQVPGSDAGAALPIGNLSWDDAQVYLKWLSEKTGRTYRLPTEAEWEYAARAGAASPYWWGDKPGTGRANCADCGNPRDGKGAVAVGTFAPNPFGLYDVHGNLWEWTQDCWNPSYEGAPADGAPWTSGDCISRVLRGGSWALGHEYMNAVKRNRYDRDVRFLEHGLRAVSDMVVHAPEDAPFETALGKAVSTLFTDAPAPATGATIVLDPVVDGLSGLRSAATRAMDDRVGDLVRAEHPQFQIHDFTEAGAAGAHFVLIGTFTGVNKQRKPAGERQAFRICLALIDRDSGKIAAKAKVFAQAAGVDITPTRFFHDNPAWTADVATQSYIKSCQATKPGEPADPRYLDRIEAAALIDEAIGAYESGEFERSQGLFRAAADAPGGEQLRTYNGLYLTSWQLGDLDQAAEAFARLLDLGLDQGALSLNFRFRPGGADFLLDPDSGAQHQLWLSRISDALAPRGDCLDIIGHLPRTAVGSAPDDLGRRRADYVRRRLQAEEPALSGRLTAMAGGVDDDLVGSATADTKDALDRRIELRVASCPPTSASRQ